MDEWQSVIKQRYDQHIKAKLEIENTLESLVNSLKNKPYNMDAKVIADDYKWVVKIQDKQIEVNPLDVSNYQQIYDEYGNPTNKDKKDLKQALIDLILDKFNW